MKQQLNRLLDIFKKTAEKFYNSLDSIEITNIEIISDTSDNHDVVINEPYLIYLTFEYDYIRPLDNESIVKSFYCEIPLNRLDDDSFVEGIFYNTFSSMEDL